MVKPVYIEDCRISVERYLHYTLSLYMNRYWWLYALPLIGCLVLSLININFLFVAVVLFFLVYTMILFFVTSYYGLVPESRFSITLKDIIVSDDGIDLILKKTTNTASEESTQPEYELEKIFLHRKSFKGFITKGDCLLVLFNKPEFSFLALPYASFESTNDLNHAINLIKKF